MIIPTRQSGCLNLTTFWATSAGLPYLPELVFVDAARIHPIPSSRIARTARVALIARIALNRQHGHRRCAYLSA
jgi:hypothetical protein